MRRAAGRPPADPARRRVYLGLFLGWMALTFFLTSIPNPQFFLPLPYADKVAHVAFYGGMGFLCALWRRECGSTPKAAILAAWTVAVLAGALDEFHQQWIPGRSADLFDWAADAAGGGIGALLAALLPSLFPFLLSE